MFSLFAEQVCKGIESQVDKNKEDRKQGGKGQQAQAGVDHQAEDVHGQFGWIAQDVPGIPAHEASHVDAGATQAGDYEYENPAWPAPEVALYDFMHQIEGDHPQQHPGPGEPDQQDDIEPERHGGNDTVQVLQVGQDVGCIGEEDQPQERKEWDGKVQPDAFPGETVSNIRQPEGDPGQEQVPDQPTILL